MRLIFTLVALCGSVSATCTGSSPTWTATPDRASVASCFASAINGDTINVSAGSATWATPIVLNKDITFIGAGVGNTILTSSVASPNAIDCFTLDFSHNNRVSGFEFHDCMVESSSNAVAGKVFRVDHNKFVASDWQQSNINGSCATPQIHPTGLFDNNTIQNYRIVIDATNCIHTDGNEADQEWAKAPPLGNSGTTINGIMQEVVYLETNTFIRTATTNTVIDHVDGNLAGRYVVRFNNIQGLANEAVEVHSMAGFGRAVQRWEIYKNNYSAVTGSWGNPPFYIRASSGVAWGNTIPVGVYGTNLAINNVRSCFNPAGSDSGEGKCAGASSYDQNSTGQLGYACRDQIGRDRDTTLWAGGAYTEPLNPAYFWNNFKTDSSVVPVVVSANGDTCTGTGGDLNSTHIQANRDYYDYNASFTGASGVGSGILAARPATCTTGVGYWATDQGSWNQSGSGGQGLLYTCSSPNTWAISYTPYAYPHPLASGAINPSLKMSGVTTMSGSAVIQ